MKMLSEYRKAKERVRQMAIDWQLTESEKPMSYMELAAIGEYFHKIGKRFGLLREFRENTIPC